MFESYLKPPISFPTLTGSIVTFNSQYALPLKSHEIALTATQSGSGTPSPDNPRPITGYSAINIGATGLNLIRLNTRASGIDLGITSEIQADNRIIASGRSTGNADISFTLANNVLLKGGQPYTFSLNGTDTRSNSIYFFIHVVGNGYANYTIPSNAHSVTFTTSRDVFIDSCLLRTFNGGTVDIDAKAQLEIGSTAHSFESYSGNAYLINLGGTYYGGEYDARSGVLTVTHGIVDLATLNWAYHPAGSQYTDYFDCYLPTDAKLGVGGTTNGLMCSIYKAVVSTAIALTETNNVMSLGTGQRRFITCDTRYTDATSYKTAMNGILLVYELATPTTIQLPPCPIDVLEGVNNIWSDVGDTTLQYPKFG